MVSGTINYLFVLLGYIIFDFWCALFNCSYPGDLKTRKRAGTSCQQQYVN